MNRGAKNSKTPLWFGEQSKSFLTETANAVESFEKSNVAMDAKIVVHLPIASWSKLSNSGNTRDEQTSLIMV